MECKKYSAGLMSQSFWFLEFKKAVKMRQEGMAYDDIKKKCVEENLFGAAKEYRALRMAGYIITRVKAMDDTLVKRGGVILKQNEEMESVDFVKGKGK